jgi:hypothetical protein
VDPGPFFYIAITIYHLLVLFTFLQTTIFYHSIRLILCLQQTGEIDNLTVSWYKVLGCVVCRFHVAASAKLHPQQGAIHTLSGAVAKLASINIRKFDSFSYWFDKPWFHTEGILDAVLITPSLGVSNRAVIYKTPTSTPHHQQVFWRRCRGERGFLQGESLASNTLLLFCFIYFCLHPFIKNTKNLVPL